METKEMKIQVPEGYEIDKENSTFECIKFKKIGKANTYCDVSNELFYMKQANIIGRYGDVQLCYATTDEDASNPIICTSSKQAEKLLAINKLMNVAKYLNEKEKMRDNGMAYYIKKCRENLNIDWACPKSLNYGAIYFNSYDLAKQAIEILGEQTIKTALSTDW